jgi:hypothetical protein
VVDFWQLPYGVRITCPDDVLPVAEAHAQMCGGVWAMEFDGARMHFRFAKRISAVAFMHLAQRRNPESDFE